VALRLRLLGPMDIDGVELGRLGSRKARLLLARLALARGRVVPAGELASVVWPDDGAPSRPADQLAVLVSRLRAALGTDRLPRLGGGYALRLDWLDVDAIADLVAEAGRRFAAQALAPARSAVDAALALDRGPLLPEEPDAPWLAAEREAAARTVVQARRLAARLALAGGDTWLATEHAEQVLAAEPYDEETVRLLMTALTRMGQPARALAVYAEFAHHLRDELGVDPGAATSALHLALLRGEPDRPVVVAPTDRLPGRDAELGLLAAALADAGTGHPVRVRVGGEAGIGKSRLLRAFTASVPAGTVLLRATGSELGRRLPLQPLLDALAAYLRRAEPGVAATVLSGPAELLVPFLGTATAGTGRPYGAVLAAFTDAGAGHGLLLAALDSALERIAGTDPILLVIDDAHWLDPSTAAWLERVPGRLGQLPLLVVLASRVEEAVALPADRMIELGPLDLAAVASIVGADRAPELFARSGGHPLFLLELAEATPGELPDSIRTSVAERCLRAGPAGATLRAAAVLGSTVDLDLLAAVLDERPAVLLDHLEEGVRRHLLVERQAGFEFRHHLVAEALRADTGASRRTLLYRAAAHWLAGRGERADPLLVAHHARAGGDDALAATALADAGEVAASRFDHDEALRHLSAAIELDDSPGLRVRRARAELPAGRFADAAADADVALAARPDAEALEVAGIAAYLLRDLDRCRRLAEDGARLATDPAVASSCYALAGRAAHVIGDLAGADQHLRRAREINVPATQALVDIWSAPLLVDQGQPRLALAALTEPALVQGQRHPFMLPHRHLAAAQAYAALGEAAAALAELDAVDAAAQGQRTPRFAARADNTRAFVLRNLGLVEEADACNTAAYELSLRQQGMGEPIVDALLGLADGRLRAGDLVAAAALLDRAAHEASVPHPFAWRHALRGRLLRGRLALARGEHRAAAATADELLAAAPIARYRVLARLLAAAADPARYPAAADDVVALEKDAPLEAWWLTAELAERTHSVGLMQLSASRRSWAERARDAVTPGRRAPGSAPEPPVPPH